MSKIIYASYIPFHVNNPYADNVMRLLEKKGIHNVPIKDCLKSSKVMKKCEIFNFNWFERVESFGEYLKKCILLDYLKINGKKIIYTIHNRQPHDIKNSKYSIKMMKKLAKKSDLILGLCDDTRNVLLQISPNSVNKLCYIAHPNYIHNYPKIPSDDEVIELKKRIGIPLENAVFLFIGAVSPYKNIEILVNAFKKIKNDNVTLLIAGRPNTDEYGNSLLKIVEDSSNIICDFRYIPEEDIPAYYKMCELVILPYDKKSSLNSGAVFLSFSLRKTVICPMIGTIKSLKDKSFLYCYDYSDIRDHETILEKTIKKAMDDYTKDKTIFRMLGNKAYEYVELNNSDECIANEYYSIYSSLI